MINIVFIVILLVIASLPGLLLYLSARNKRLLAEQECKMASAVLKMDRLLLEAVITNGDVCHYIVYSAMCRTQSKREYGFEGVFSSPSERQRQFMKKFDEEVRLGDPRLKNALDEFSSGYIKAAQISCRVRFWMIIFLLFMIAGGIRFAIATIRQVENINQAIRSIKQEIRNQYVARSLSVISD